MAVLFFHSGRKKIITSDPHVIQLENINEIYSITRTNRLATSEEALSRMQLNDTQIKNMYRVHSRWLNLGLDLYNFEFECEELYRSFIAYLKINKITAVLMGTSVPHHIDTLILDYACDALGVKRVFPILTNLTDKRYLLIEQDGDNFSRKPINLVGKVKNQKNMQEIENEIQNLSKFHKPSTSTQRKKWKNSFFLAKIYSILKYVRDNYIRKETHKLVDRFSLENTWLEIKNQKNFLRNYNKYAKNLNNDGEDKIIFFSSYQPEASTLPLGGEYFNQLSALTEISSHFPRVKKYYKEHPTIKQFLENKIGLTRVGRVRTASYLRKILELNFIPLSLSTPNYYDFDSQERTLICTVSGSIALQRSLAGLRTVIFGNHWFNDTPGIITWKRFKSLSDGEQAKYFETKSDARIEHSARVYVEKVFNENMVEINLPAGRDREIEDIDAGDANLLSVLSFISKL